MTGRNDTFTPPRVRLLGWLASPGMTTPVALHGALLGALFGSLPVYFAALVNSIVTAGVVALHHDNDVHFDIWFVAELVICLTRLAALTLSLRRAAQGRSTPTDLYMLLTLLWAASLGYGGFITIQHGDWRTIAIVCLSVAAMAGGACLRNYSAPRFAIVQLLMILGPCAVAALLSREPVLLVVLIQLPFFSFSMATSAFRLNRMLVKTMEAELDSQQRALHDPLTGLCNRAGLEQGHATRRGHALFYIDLDGFKQVNDAHGHAVGDAVLLEVAARLRGTIGPEALVARTGGDEFVVLAAATTQDEALAIGDAISQTLRRPYRLNDAVIQSGGSIGIALPDANASLSELMKRADGGLYRIKALGGDARLADGAIGTEAQLEIAGL